MRAIIERIFGTTKGQKRRTTRPSLEALEDRAVPALFGGLGVTANLWITDAFLVNDAGDRIDSTAVGEMVHVKATFKSLAIPAGSMTVSASIDDGPAQTMPFQIDATFPGEVSWFAKLGTFALRPGTHNVHVVIDANNDYHELNPNDNVKDFSVTPDAKPPQFIIPLGGIPNFNWTIMNYVDNDPAKDSSSDYRGGDFTYEGHRGVDIVLPTFAQMDQGVPVLAAALGTVVDTDTGHFDRSIVADNSQPVNFVTLDNGNGWQTIYLHLRKDSHFVNTGDLVTPREQIGWVGSSGDSTDAHLHFEVHHNGDVVDTFLDADTYWSNPDNDPAFRTYAGDLPSGVLDLGTSASDPETLLNVKERPVAPTDPAGFTAGSQVFAWAILRDVHPGHTISFVWHRPDGSTFGEGTIWAPPTDGSDFGMRFGHRSASITLPTDIESGDWNFAVLDNGTELSRNTFRVIGTPQVSFAVARSSGSESVGTVVLDVVLSQPSDQTVTVNYAFTGGTATGMLGTKSTKLGPIAIPGIIALGLGADYLYDNGTLTFAPGQTQQQIRFTVLNDGTAERNETVEVTLSGAVNSRQGTTTHTYTILDDDGGVAPIPQPPLPPTVGGQQNLPVAIVPQGNSFEQTPVSKSRGHHRKGGHPIHVIHHGHRPSSHRHGKVRR
jgi:murein DD-endopeptidase MepM/ murein hydrolase activator NlpD